jgi:hypothetical protein
MIFCITQSYKTAYGLSKVPYILGYGIYVAETIHVRNAAGDAASNSDYKGLLISTIDQLGEMSKTNPGVKGPLRIIKQLMSVDKVDLDIGEPFSFDVHDIQIPT